MSDRKILPALEGIFEPGPHDEPRLKALRCASCSRTHFPPPAPVCPACFSEDLEEVTLSTEGTVHSFTEVHTAPPGFQPPYVLAYVDLSEGVRLLGQMDGEADEVAVGSVVEMTTGTVRSDEDGTEWIGYRFRKAGSEDA